MKNHRIQRVLIAAFCSTVFSASASDIQMFGFFDQGLAYLHEDLNAGMGGPAGQSINAPQYVDKDGYVAEAQTKRSFTQGSGNVSTWGIKGSEQINADVRVLFHLESGFLADDGTLYGGSVKPLFERESSIGVESKTWGLVKFGRMPALSTGSGTTGILNSKVNPFGAGWGNMTGGWKFAGTLAAARHDNMIHYISPSFSGVRLHAQYSFKSAPDNGREEVFVGGHYNFDVFRLFGTVQYLKNMPWIGGYSTKEVAPLALGSKGPQKGFEAWAFSTGVDFRAVGGKVMTSVGYAAAKNQNLESQNKLNRVNFGLGYQYSLSKRTSLYGIGGYFWQDADWQKKEISAHEFIVGMMHRW